MASYDVSAISFGDNTYNFNKVRQGVSTSAKWRRILMCYTQDDTAKPESAEAVTDGAYTSLGIAAQPSTGTVRATKYNVNDKCRLQWNATDEALEFVFL